jgi:hypothetical protein
MHIFRINIRDSHSPSERSFVTSRNILLLIEFVDDECAGSMGESISLDLLVNGPRELDDDRVKAGRVVRSFLQSFSSLLPAYFYINKADCDLKTLRGSARLFILKIHSCLARQVGCLESFWKTSFVFTTFPITDQEQFFFTHIEKIQSRVLNAEIINFPLIDKAINCAVLLCLSLEMFTPSLGALSLRLENYL